MKTTLYAIFRVGGDKKVLLTVKTDRNEAIDYARFLHRASMNDYAVFESDETGFFGNNAKLIHFSYLHGNII